MAVMSFYVDPLGLSLVLLAVVLGIVAFVLARGSTPYE
jgi:hypothetical protein